jgi:hypothetical protein
MAVAHFVLEMLPEPHPLGVNSNAAEEQPSAADEVREGLVCNDALGNGIT